MNDHFSSYNYLIKTFNPTQVVKLLVSVDVFTCKCMALLYNTYLCLIILHSYAHSRWQYQYGT